MVAVKREASVLMIESKYAEARGLWRLRIYGFKRTWKKKSIYDLTVLGFDTLTFSFFLFSTAFKRGFRMVLLIGADFYLFIHIRGI